MEEKILQAILEEIKGLRKDNGELRAEFQGLRKETGELKTEFQGLRKDTGELKIEIQGLRKEFEGVKSVVEVLQISSNLSRQELTKIREILGEKVIWNNEIITFELKDGTKQYGTIHKGEK